TSGSRRSHGRSWCLLRFLFLVLDVCEQVAGDGFDTCRTPGLVGGGLSAGAVGSCHGVRSSRTVAVSLVRISHSRSSTSLLRHLRRGLASSFAYMVWSM